MEFRIDLPLQVSDEGDDLRRETEVKLQIHYRSGKWNGQCTDPPVFTEMCDSLQGAIVSAVREIQKDWKSNG